jgi:hypothetical protein
LRIAQYLLDAETDVNGVRQLPTSIRAHACRSGRSTDDGDEESDDENIWSYREDELDTEICVSYFEDLIRNRPKCISCMPETSHLQLACHRGFKTVVELLVKHRADVGTRVGTNARATALQYASMHGFLAIVLLSLSTKLMSMLLVQNLMAERH